MPEDYYSKDLRLLGVACKQFAEGLSSPDRFVEDVRRILRGYDAITLSLTLWQVEATIRQHFCEFWDECQDGKCFAKESPSFWLEEVASWSPLPMPKERKAKQKKRKIGLRLRFDVLKRDGYRCQLCGKTAAEGCALEVDHKHPKSKGGADVISNLWVLCFDCNRGKYTAPV